MSEGGTTPVPRTTSPTPRASNLDWDDLKVFVAVADTGSIAAAARRLGVTHSMVSKRVDELEHRLGSTLFTRSAKGMALTETGILAREHALLMSRSVEALVRQASARDKRQEGRVTIAAPDGVAAYWLAPRLAGFQRENPKIQINVDCGFWAATPMADPADLTLTTTEEKRLDYVCTPLAVLHYVLFAAPSYLATYGAPTSLGSIADHRLLNFTPIVEQPENWHPKAAALRELIEFSIETNSSAMLFETLRAGGGIAVAPTAVKSFAPDLVMIYPEPMSHITLWLTHHRDAMAATRVRTVADWLKGVFDGRAQPWFRADFVHPDNFF